MFFIGCPAWGYKEWVGSFFPARTAASDFLRLYSKKLNTVEGNTTFYALPGQETIKRWVQETPPTFRLCPKVSRTISHSPQLDMHKEETVRFIERMSGLKERLGPIFLQLPPSFGPTQLPLLQNFLNFWPTDVRLAVEVRHHDFYTEQSARVNALNTLLTQYNVARVLMDTRPIRVGSAQEQQLLQARERKPNLPLQIAVTTDFTFVRYIGHPRMEVNEPLLDQWADQLAQWFKQGITLYIFCHCPFEEYSPTICLELYKRVKALAPIPVLPLTTGENDEPEQKSLF